MRHRTFKLGLIAALALSAALPLAATQSAYADYAPSKADVVGVGADALQYIVDFLADGDAYGDTGYNQIGNKNKLISLDATADANGRLAYGVNGGQAAQTTCTPGTGSTAGTGNATGTNTGAPCVLNPTAVLRAGTQPVQRPNGTGGGFKALVQDIVAGNNGGTKEVINFVRASATQSTAATLPSGVNIDQLEVATDTLPILVSKSPTSHAFPLSAAQLSLIYAANSGSCLTWNDPRISGVVVSAATTTSGSTSVTYTGASNQVTAANEGWPVSGPGIPAGDTIANVVPAANSFTLTTAAGSGAGAGTVSLTNPSASSDQIIPIIPQIGAGVRTTFLSLLSPALSNPGTCAQVAETNDPTAIAALGATDAIEPITQSRLDIYGGVTSTGTNGGIGGYFLDPSCAYLSGTSGCGTGSVSGGNWRTSPVDPSVQTLTGTPVGTGGSLFDPTTPLYLYFRSGDITSTTPFQSPGTENWLNTLFYDPCLTGQTCTTQSSTGSTQFGPAGPPYLMQPEGQTLLQDAGVTPINPEVCTDITTSTAC